MAGPRKNPGEYSANPNTVKARARKDKLKENDPVKAEVEAARHSLLTALSRARAKVRKTPEYATATPVEREKLLKEACEAERDKRYVLVQMW